MQISWCSDLACVVNTRLAKHLEMDSETCNCEFELSYQLEINQNNKKEEK
jgi:hypothetical protein